MKAALTLTLTASLIASSLPAAAQFPHMPPPRYAPPYQYPPPPPPVLSDWTHVRAIEPRSRIRVSAIGLADRDHQYFVSASDRTLTLLTVGALPRSAKQLVMKLAGMHPEFFSAPEKWMEFSDGPGRATPDGLFVRGRKVAGLTDVAKTIDVGDVAEVWAEVPIQRTHDLESHSPAVVATFFAALYGTMAVCKDRCGNGALAIIVGAPVAAGIIAAGRTSRTMQVVYRAR